MKTKNKNHLVSFIFAFLLLPFFGYSAGSSIVITEIMYDADGSDTDHEWIEIYNNSSTSVDITKYKLYENDTDHGITSFDSSKELAAGGYAVIAASPSQFKKDYPTFSGAIFDSSFSLSNDTGELIGIKDENKNILDQLTYNVKNGANGDGKTLQFVNNSWSALDPSPGYASSSSNSNTNNNTSSGSNTNNLASIATVPVKIYEKEPKMEFVFSSPRTSVTGNTVTFKSVLYSTTGSIIRNGKFVWNFGDGATAVVYQNDPVEHIYNFAGDYVITLTYMYGQYYTKPVVVGKTNISIIDSPLQITEIYQTPFRGIKLSNTASDEIDISGYIVRVTNGSLTLPENTYIGSSKSIVLGTGDYLVDKNSVLLYPNGMTAAVFVAPATSQKLKTVAPLAIGTTIPSQSNTTTLATTSDSLIQNPNIDETQQLDDSILSDPEDRGTALAEGTDFIDLDQNNSENAPEGLGGSHNASPLYFILLLVSVISFTLFVYFLYIFFKKPGPVENSQNIELQDDRANLYTLQEEID